MKQYLEFVDESSSKFWSVSTDDCTVTVVFGKIGTAGQTKIKEFDSPNEAEKQAEKQAAAKTKKGYALATPPESFGAVSSSTSSKPAAKSAQKKATPAKAKLSKIPTAVTDDGTLKPWHEEDSGFWEYGWHCCDEESFSIDALLMAEEADAPKPAPKKEEKVSDEKPEKSLFNWGVDSKGEYIMSTGAVDDDDAYDEDDDDSTFSEGDFANIARRESLEKLIAMWDAAKKDGIEEKDLKSALDVAASKVLYFTFTPNGRKNLEWILAQSKEIKFINHYIDDPFAKLVVKTYKETKDAKKTCETLDKFLDKSYDKMTRLIENGLRDVMEALISGEGNEKKNIKLPEADQMEWLHGLRIYTWQDSVYISPLVYKSSYSPYKLFSANVPETDGIDTEVSAEYLPQKLRPIIQKMVDEGLFEKFPAYKICIKYDDKEVFHEKILDKKAYDEKVKVAEELVNRLETTTDFVKDSKFLEKAFYSLLNIIEPVDVRRMTNLYKRFLYSLNDEAEDAACEKIYGKYIDNYPEMEYERALWKQANGDFGTAHSIMGELEDKGYAPAAEKYKEYEQLAIERAKLLKDQKVTKKSSNRKKVNFNHFTENDLFVNTDNIIARADSRSRIRLRFKVEGEAGYSEALDYLNNLLEKGYARLDGGYTLEVRFLRQPEFIKQLPDFPKNTCHAFFAAAVKYPELREKVRRYAELALVDFDWYKDLDGEQNTIPGTFAACALAFCDEKYIHMSGKYARHSDNEHQYIQMELPYALVKFYGAVPEVAKAIFDVCCSNGQDGDIGRMPKTLWTLPENLQAVMEHIENGTAIQHHQEVHFSSYVEAIIGSDVKRNLKKIVIVAKESAPEDQKVFEDFYNQYKNYASEWHDEDYGNDLNLTSKAEGSKVSLPQYKEGEPLVMSLKEFKEKYPDRELQEGEDGYPEERRTVIFMPNVIDDPYAMDYLVKSWNLCGKIAREAPTSVFWHPIAIQMGDWVINITEPAKQYGAIMFEGKKKPYVLYGKFNIVPLFSRFHKRPFKSAEEAETARLSNLLEEAPDFVPVPKKLEAAAKKYDEIASALIVERNYAASVILPQFTPEDEYIYDAALIQRAMLAHRFVDKAAEKAIYEELKVRRPEYAEYWAQKLGER